MRSIIIYTVIILISYIPGYAMEYTHPDGSHISINLPEGLPEAVEKTVRDEIRVLIPTETLDHTLTITPDTTMTGESIDTKNWEHTIRVQKIYGDDSITSVLITSYEYTGGAHGSMARIGLVVDTKTGKKLSLADFYHADTLTKILAPVWQKQINTRLRTNIGTNLSSDEKKWIHDGVTGIQQYQSFILTPRVLIVYGQQYQHNAYAYGMQTLTFPRNRLMSVIR